MHKNRGLILLLAICMALLIAIIPLAGACTKEPEKPKELKVGMITPTTGPAAEKGAPGNHGLMDAMDYINKELGGAGGIPIKVLGGDSRYDNAQVVTLVKGYMDEGALMFTTMSSKEMTAAMEIANRAEFPGMAVFTAQNLYHPPAHIYGQMPDYGDDWTAFANYYMKNVWKGTGKPKMALHLLNNSTGAGAKDAAKAGADTLGIEIIATEEHAATTISEMESMTRIKAKKPDVLFISSTPAPTAVIMKNAYELGIYPGIVVGAAHASFTKALVDLAGANIVEGVYGVYPTLSWDDTSVPGIVKATEYVKKNNAKDFGNMDYLSLWSTSLVTAEILRTAVKNAGYDVLAKGNVDSWRAIEKQGIQKLNGYNVEGIHAPVKYVAGDNRLDKYVKLYQIKGGKIVSLGDWIEAPLIKYEDLPWWGK